MLTFAWYLLKVIICSGILYGYYLLALRNKIFHRWNRFYLLAAVILSLSVPLIKINIWQRPDQPKTQVVQLLQVVSSSDEVVFNYTKDGGSFRINTSNISGIIYLFVAGLLLVFLIRTFLKIEALKRNSPKTVVEGINFINTDARGTPFSFFNTIFWNTKIDIHDSTGRKIFQHEVAHVQEKHSYDKIFMNIVLVFYWCNPFFWLMRKELNLIHEFIADQRALEDSDTAAFAAMILQATYPLHQFSITNNFFYSPLKRRLLMLTKNKNPKINYLSRLLVLPLAALVFFAFTLKMRTMRTMHSNGYYTGKKITVIIDAGHGGADNGISMNNINEKDLTLSIAKKIKEINTNQNIDIILSRKEDEYINPYDRVEFSKANSADLFVSIHIDGSANIGNGIHIFIPQNDNSYLKDSKILGSDISRSFKDMYSLPVANILMQRQHRIVVLKENTYPAVLIEVGALNNKKDVEYLIKPENQETIARNILAGIEKYVMQGKNPISISKTDNDSIPHYYKGKKIKTAYGSNKLNKALIFYTDGSSDTISINEAEKIRIIPPPPGIMPQAIPDPGKTDVVLKQNADISPQKEAATIHIKEKASNDTTKHPLLIVDGKEVPYGELKNLNPNNIESINILKGEEAFKIYGNRSKDGVIAITLKKGHPSSDTARITAKIFTKTEISASFPGGDMGWNEYITKKIREHIDELTESNVSGTCRVRFIVNVDGSINDVTAMNMRGTKLAEIFVDAIRTGPKWIPAQQNGHIVPSYREQPVTFTIQKQ